jgi:hypothetical protein
MLFNLFKFIFSVLFIVGAVPETRVDRCTQNIEIEVIILSVFLSKLSDLFAIVVHKQLYDPFEFSIFFVWLYDLIEHVVLNRFF